MILADIAIVSTPLLPEPIPPALLPGFQPFQTCRALVLTEAHDLSPDGLLDTLEDFRYRIIRAVRTDQEMYVFRHEHIRPQGEVVPQTSRCYGLDKISQGAFTLQQRSIVKTTEGQFVGVPRYVVSFTALTMFAVRLHKGIVAIHTAKASLAVPPHAISWTLEYCQRVARSNLLGRVCPGQNWQRKRMSFS